MFEKLKSWFASASQETPEPEPEPKQEPQAMPRYFRADGMLPLSIQAGFDNGSVKPWRVDADGNQWLVRDEPRTIKAIAEQSGPPEPTEPSERAAYHDIDADDCFDRDEFDAKFEAKRVWLNRLLNFQYGNDNDE